jgi:hypothetical protein
VEVLEMGVTVTLARVQADTPQELAEALPAVRLALVGADRSDGAPQAAPVNVPADKAARVTALFGVISNGSELTWPQPRKKAVLRCRYVDGEFELPDGQRFASPTAAANAAAGGSNNGRKVWRYRGRSLNDWRMFAGAVQP